MKIKEEGEEVTVYIEDERIDITNSKQLKDKILLFIEQGFKRINLDFSEVKMIDSSGIGKLLLSQKRLKEVDGKLSLVNIKSDYIKKIIRLIHLDEVIEVKEG
ncbi:MULTISPECIES: STAS domain-containing protein [unclassified Candidatus Frackibacter]|uniref:STAS domain-containing protein n=1 Tax=unclassified Candidatus Frackibacter TaxID=2648818 RepID=UPI0008836880|nr:MULTISPECIES: STAS domain-containing protein [unclassified Candidatus Frackibacter]SDC87188.1 anti-sigma B factor antagonist [Candidatus Frackibacter sp. WG11]SEN01492.1 anti-sigma B factor antagonist [Candidatus Frackibacter sp. WG12]SFM08984.1 anti-sigma B factor antagonist [Candidatus Frackibacter sp. WG13]